MAEGDLTALYSLAFVSFALGGLFLLGNITGNVVRVFGEGGGIILASVLIGLGVAGSLILSRKMEG